VINGLDLFSGIGGISLALKDLVRPLAYVEIDDYCQKVLKERMSEGKLHRGGNSWRC
jgi:site-specific DNA-cytosine methylase